MTGRDVWTVFEVAAAYVGTVVGAGFASGQEVYRFFGRYQIWGVMSVLLSVVLFAVLGHRLASLGHRLRASSYAEVTELLFGRMVGRWMNAILAVMLFGVIVAMMAGAGEVFREHLGLPFGVGVLFTGAITYLTATRGIKGIFRANALIVPTMLAFLLFSAIHTFGYVGSSVPLAGQFVSGGGSWVLSIVSGVVYVAMNVSLACGVLIPLGSNVVSPRSLKLGTWLGAVVLGTMLLSVFFTLLAYSPQAIRYQVPMGFVASHFSPILRWIFVIVLWGEIFSTLVGNVYSVQSYLAPKARHQAILIILSLAAMLSTIGFSNIVSYGYVVFGYVGILFLGALLWPRLSGTESRR